jgi:hypothetical protein
VFCFFVFVFCLYIFFFFRCSSEGSRCIVLLCVHVAVTAWPAGAWRGVWAALLHPATPFADALALYMILRENLFLSPLFAWTTSPALRADLLAFAEGCLRVGADIIAFMQRYPDYETGRAVVPFLAGRKLEKCTLFLRLLVRFLVAPNDRITSVVLAPTVLQSVVAVIAPLRAQPMPVQLSDGAAVAAPVAKGASTSATKSKTRGLPFTSSLPQMNANLMADSGVAGFVQLLDLLAAQ